MVSVAFERSCVLRRGVGECGCAAVDSAQRTYQHQAVVLRDLGWTPRASIHADENITLAQAAELVGAERAKEVERVAIALYEKARDFAATKGIIIADTKFEFGVDAEGRLVLGDEALTPDSSRFWPASEYAPGRGQNSYDKQYVRDYLESIKFDKKTPVAMPEDVISATQKKYVEVFEILTGRAL
eukprot:Opistho-2@24123